MNNLKPATELPPDDIERRIAGYQNQIPACIHCGEKGLLTSKQGERIFVSEVFCTNTFGCGHSVFAQGETREAAQTKAIQHWGAQVADTEELRVERDRLKVDAESRHTVSMEHFREREKATVEKFHVKTIRQAANAIFNTLNGMAMFCDTGSRREAILSAQSLANAIVESDNAELPLGKFTFSARSEYRSSLDRLKAENERFKVALTTITERATQIKNHCEYSDIGRAADAIKVIAEQELQEGDSQP